MKKFMKEVAAFAIFVAMGILAIVDTIINVIYLTVGLIRQGVKWFGEKSIEKVAPVYRGREGYLKVIQKLTSEK